MRTFIRPIILVATLLPLPVPAVIAQTAVDPSGHWQGSLRAPDSPIAFEVDLAKNAAGELAGALTIPSQHIKGLPLGKISVNGTTVIFQARSDQSFSSVVSADRTSMSGQFTVGGATVPFDLTRAGEARLEAPPKSAPIAKELEGVWNGTLMVDGAPLRMVLTMSNQPDGTATGRIVNVDQGGLLVPVAIRQDGSTVTIDSQVIAGAFSGRLNSTGTELVGTYTQGPLSAPLTFRRQP
jgi:hypothetical protein